MTKEGNDQEYLKIKYRVLRDLASSDSALGFNKLQEKTSVSSRTLAKHLKHLVPKNVQKEGEKYRITDTGRQLIEDIKRDLELWNKKGESYQSHEEIVEVYSISSKHFCRGTIKVTSTKKLLPKERKKLDKAITSVIRTFISSVPENSRNWKISIYSHTRAR
ncbi:DUF7347 domain-containing protein [[Eubacterium] cellulosolvens]